MPSPSKNKGSGFEREVSKFLSELYGENFMRAPGSGAFIGGGNQHRKSFLHEAQVRTFKGDIIPGESFPGFNAECKFYADFAFHQLFEQSKLIDNWIDQLMAVSDAGDFNILMMKFNRKGRYVAVESTGGWCVRCNHFTYTTSNHGTWLVFPFEPFFELNALTVKLLSSKNQTENTNHISGQEVHALSQN
jgi:hypothetical protein